MKEIWGDLIDEEGMQETPLRVLKHWVNATSGLLLDPAEPLQKTFECNHDEVVLLKNIPVFSLCEHHLLPFFGKAHVGYIPGGRVVGLSKIARSLDIFASRPQIQERLTNDFANLLMENLAARAVMVVIEAEHTCISTRGALKPGTTTVTSCVLGLFQTDASARSEVLSLVRS